MDALTQALALVLSAPGLAAVAGGVCIGIVLGALPGIGGAQALALLSPLAFGLSAPVSLIFFVAVYGGAEYGGSIPAILLRTPGTPAQSVTVLDGYAMARSGRPRRALRISLLSAVFGGVLSTLLFLAGGIALAQLALHFGPGAMFALGMLGLAVIAGYLGRDPLKGLVAVTLGLLLGTVGSSDFGSVRFAFGQPFLVDGLPLVVVIIGLLAGPQALRMLLDDDPAAPAAHRGGNADDVLPWREALRLIPTWLRAGALGTVIGAIPGLGPAIAAPIAYQEERRWSREGHRFGEGVDQAVAAPETANNAVVAGTLVPSLALGIPGSAGAAVLVGILISKGVVPGPMLFRDDAVLIAALFCGLLLANVVLLIVGGAAARLAAPLMRVPRDVLAPLVLVLVLVGSYAYATYSAHMVIALALAVTGYWFEKIEVPVIPMVLAFVIQPIIERNLARALTIRGGDWGGMLAEPLTGGLLLAALLTVLLAVRRRATKRND